MCVFVFGCAGPSLLLGLFSSCRDLGLLSSGRGRLLTEGLLGLQRRGYLVHRLQEWQHAGSAEGLLRGSRAPEQTPSGCGSRAPEQTPSGCGSRAPEQTPSGCGSWAPEQRPSGCGSWALELGLSGCGSWALEQRPSGCGSVVVAPGLSCFTTCGIFLDQCLNPCLLQ